MPFLLLAVVHVTGTSVSGVYYKHATHPKEMQLVSEWPGARSKGVGALVCARYLQAHVPSSVCTPHFCLLLPSQEASHFWYWTTSQMDHGGHGTGLQGC